MDASGLLCPGQGAPGAGRYRHDRCLGSRGFLIVRRSARKDDRSPSLSAANSVRCVLVASRSATKLWRYWGLIPFAVIIISLGTANGLGPGVYLLLIALLIFYVLFQAPMWCGAVNRSRTSAPVEYCRNNSSGLLLGCNRVRQHKWQKLQNIWWATKWRENTRGIWMGPAAKLATVTGLIGTITGIFGMFKG